jgi:hypothetical protein
MGAVTFSRALEQAAQLALAAMPDHAVKIDDAVTLIKAGKVLQLDDGHTWEVESASVAGKRYTLNGAGCPCADAHYRGGYCKHKMATLLVRKAMHLLEQPAPPAPITAESAVLPEAPPAPKLDNVSSLPEAPSSVNLKVQLYGQECQITLRDHDETRLLARLEVLLKDQRIRPVPKPAPRQGQWKQRREYQGR